MPQTSNPSSRALALMDSAVSMHHKRRNAERSSSYLVPGNELPEHVGQDSAMTERHQLLRRIDSHERLKFDGVIADGPHGHVAHGLETVLDADNLKDLTSGGFRRCGNGTA